MNTPKKLLVIKRYNYLISFLNMVLCVTLSAFIYTSLNEERETYLYSNEGYIKKIDYSEKLQNKIRERLSNE